MTLPKTSCSVCGKPITLQRKQKAKGERWACKDCFDKRGDTHDPAPKDRSFALRLDMNNAAFDEDWRQETARILLALADELAAGNCPRFLMDMNGNTVGAVSVTGEVS